MLSGPWRAAAPDPPSKASIPPRHLGRLATWPRADAQQPKGRPQRASTSGKALPSPAKPFARGLVPAYLVFCSCGCGRHAVVRPSLSVVPLLTRPVRSCWPRVDVDVDADMLACGRQNIGGRGRGLTGRQVTFAAHAIPPCKSLLHCVPTRRPVWFRVLRRGTLSRRCGFWALSTVA